MTFQQGQEVRYISDIPRRSHREMAVTIEKVGRKYATVVIHGRLVQFDKETGYVKSDYTGMSRERIVTDEMLADEEHQARVNAYLKKYGVFDQLRSTVRDPAHREAVMKLLIELGYPE